MATVTVLTALARIDQRKVERRLASTGYVVVADRVGLRVSHDAHLVAVFPVASVAQLPDRVIDAAKKLLGRPPGTAVTCSFDGVAHQTPAWSTVVDVARAVASDVPLAVLDDNAGTTYLVHPGRGLIGPQEYEKARRNTPAVDFLLRLLGGGA